MNVYALNDYLLLEDGIDYLVQFTGTTSELEWLINMYSKEHDEFTPIRFTQLAAREGFKVVFKNLK